MAEMCVLKFADIEEQYAKDEQLKREDIAKLEEWQRMQPHLPSALHPIETALVLQSCCYSIEAAKQCIDNYYTFHTHCPEIFANRDPFSAELQIGMRTMCILALPDLTPEGYLVIYGQLLNRNPNAFNLATMWKMIDMIGSLTFRQRGCQKGLVVIINLEGTTMSHMLKWGIRSIQNALTYFQTAIPVQIQAVHVTNCVFFMDKILAIINPFLGKVLKDKIHLHYGDIATLLQDVPKEMLPIECGGEDFCAHDYYRAFTRKEIESHSTFFKVTEGRLVDESKRPGKRMNIEDFSGIQGTFKKFEFD